MLEGVLVKAKGGFYYAMVAQGEVVRCRARGRLKGEGAQLLVGDRVEVSFRQPGDGMVERIFPRKNSLIRPSIANVDQVVVVITLHEPPLDLHLLHRIIVAAGAAGLAGILCFNKLDLLKTAADRSRIQELENVFRASGYTVLRTSSLMGEGLDLLRDSLKGKTSVLAGPSGAGKSTLLNRLKPDLNLESASISPKTGRGRHTTRHVELVSLDEYTFVADTPGFQRLDVVRIPARRLAAFFPEIAAREGECRFIGCLHHREPGCAVKETVENGEIAPWRYEMYLYMLDAINKQESVY